MIIHTDRNGAKRSKGRVGSSALDQVGISVHKPKQQEGRKRGVSDNNENRDADVEGLGGVRLSIEDMADVRTGNLWGGEKVPGKKKSNPSNPRQPATNCTKRAQTTTKCVLERGKERKP